MSRALLRLLILAASAWLGLVAAVHAATPLDPRIREAGTPLIRGFGAADYGGAVQNWDVVQDARGVIYVANTEDGVLEYDGVRWRKIPTPERGTIRSLAVDAAGRIWVGSVGDLGYLEPDAAGNMRFVSLRERLPVRERDFADVWRILPTAQGVYFSTFKRLIRFDGRQIRTWTADKPFHIAGLVNGRIFVREVGRGLLQLVDDTLKPVPEGERFAQEKIYAMLPWASGSMLIGTRSQGWFIHDGQRLQPWPTEVDAELVRDNIYGAIWLRDGRLAVATLRGGLYLLDREGRLLGHLDKGSGLPDQTIYQLYQDRQGALWLALDNGLAWVDITAPLTVFGSRSGVAGSAVALHRYQGSLYVGTTQGMFRLRTRPVQTADFVAVAGIEDQTWAFLDDRNGLLAATNRGVYELRDGRVQLVLATDQGVFALARSRRDPARVFVGLQNGIASIRHDGQRWRSEGPAADMTDEVRTIVETDDGSLWLGSFNTGVLKLSPRAGSDERPSYQVQRYTKAQGVPPGTTYVHMVGGRLTVASTRGMLGLATDGSGFVPDPRFAGTFAHPRWISGVAEDAQGRVWMFTQDQDRALKESGVAIPGADGRYVWDARAMRHVASDSALASMVDDGVVWFGGDAGVYRYDTRLQTGQAPPFAAQVRQVSTRGGRTVYGGSGPAALHELEFADNSLRFELAAMGYELRPPRFQVLLEGLDREWSPWSTDSHRDYTGLQEGDYRLRVRAMDPFGQSSAEASYAFAVLPPWWRTLPAYAIYLLMTAGVLALLARWRSAALQTRNRQLEALVATRTAELSSANQGLQAANAALAELSATDVLTGLRNRRYLVDHIEHDVAAALRATDPEPRHAIPPGHHELLFVMVDLDHFKHVNDQYGHAAGDRVLEQFAAILRQVCRDTDIPVRWGGEEFLIVARGAEPGAGAALAERIRAQTEAHRFDIDDGRVIGRTCSVGFASFPVWPAAPKRCSWELAIELADQCLYQAKRTGRNRWCGLRGTARVPAADASTADLQTLIDGGHLRLLEPAQEGGPQPAP